MNKTDFSVKQTGLNGAVSFYSSLTNLAQPNSEYEVHAHYNEFEIYYFIEGNLYFAFEGKRYTVKENTMLIIPPGMLHRPIIKTPGRYYRKRILFNKNIFSNLNASALSFSAVLRKRKLIIISNDDVRDLQLNTLFEQIEASISKNIPYEDFCTLITLFSLLIKCEKISRHHDNKLLYNSNKKVDEIVRYIEENLTEDLSYKALSEKFYISEKSLYKLFKKETGFTLSNYINERRIIKAQSVLNAGGTANEAAIVSGYNDYSVFYRSFIRKVRISPAEYIKELTNCK